MRVLYIGGSGEISFDCIHETVRLGHEVTVFNRGRNNAGLPPACRFVTGDVGDDAAYSRLAAENFDVICQFRLFSPAEIQRDIGIFSGHCGQYVFISSASAYAKPVRHLPITEQTPLHNPHWAYSRAKAEMEAILRAQTRLPYTIVRPSHTYRTHMPTPLGGEVSRLLRGLPVIIHGDGESLWTITYARDFAPPFARLLGHPRALGEAFHITHDRQWSWNEISEAIAAALGVRHPRWVHVSSDTLIRYNPEWEGPLLGDKAPSVQFDNSKAKSVVGDFECLIDPWQGMKLVAANVAPSAVPDDGARDALYDKIIADQEQLGR
ncbi:NAD-dependent epimerase/dehydratase family protein [Stigmatella aurantiaca]|uniref:NAD-dependent epimerase/dehydratase n=1 Tax=Stigmatella aurantiaca (strain DW4/3-1) TaxID=378806 RepID=Q08Z97_STIAD|nr:NAD-dependent epimerase/dehydratase family protein [Stigmatella aurantiaca]ADO73904.1 NAD-dependent epimerase/dehydratase [Stigmatella aurantiaca DW4/3-1]EAU65831.1 putative mRNA-binding protein [Stigmatella aurantiaca DW4/3-1]